MAASTNKAAQALKSLVQRKGRPLILTNVYDRLSAQAVAELPQTEALATASHAIANAAGLPDEGLDFETNIAAVRDIAAVAKQHGKPLTVDMQDGYGAKLERNVGRLIELGVAGVNIEDTELATGKLYPAVDAALRIRRALDAAADLGVPGFVVNARCDGLLLGGGLGEVLDRGKRYLEAGATTIFVIGGSERGGVSRGEVEELVRAFDGRLNVILKRSADGLSTKDLAEMGVARISVGPTLQAVAMAALKKEAAAILDTN
ncbi:phosphoenolpyruvate phosphomutase-domain-containing protein [Apiospora kogelbergensis]|uniref:Phosphoenolpyruvate phosphomutase-domain-containing protein n=1 Tax=Apiospora kogelbergensis TaxID=1337665 RepID=A0AAW0QKD2_9PEZI